EERLAAIATAQPDRGGAGDLVRAALGSLFAGIALVKLLVENVEPLTKAESSRDRIRTDEGRRGVAKPLETRRQRNILFSHAEHDVVADAMHRRVEGGEGCRVRGAGKGGCGVNLVGGEGFGRESVGG